MIRFKMALGSVLLGGLILSPMALGQEPPKGDEVSRERARDVAKLEEVKILELKPNADALAEQAEARVTRVYKVEQQPQEQADEAKSRVLEYRARTLAEYPNLNYTANFRQLTGGHDALESNFGLSLSEADEALRTQLEIPQGQGVVIVGVKPASLAEQAGLKMNDVLLSLGDEKVGEALKARKILLGLGKEALEVKLIREGKPRRMSLVGPEHGFPPEAAEYWIGVPVSPVDATLRAHLPALAAETGLIANDVVKESPAERAGVHKNDILVSLDGKPVKTSEALIAAIRGTQGKAVPLELLRAGKPITITVAPAKRAHPTVINYMGQNPQHMYQFVRPNLAFEVNPQATYHLFNQQGAKDGTLEVRINELLQSKPADLNSQRPTQVLAPPSHVQVNGPNQIQLELRANQPRPEQEASTARLEAQLKEMSAKLEEIRKIVEGLKKPESK